MEKSKTTRRSVQVRRKRPKRDANSLCPCKSGRKWKRCHGRTFLPDPKEPLSVFSINPQTLQFEQRLPEEVRQGGSEECGVVETREVQPVG